MKYLTVIAKIKSQLDKTEIVFENLQSLVEPTRKEKGCIDYDLCRDNDNPSIFVFYENWENSDDLDAHMKSDHFEKCFSNIEGMFEVEVNRFTKIS
jgi:quinol monooxygenase YgiN